jgi:hypothetical protein
LIIYSLDIDYYFLEKKISIFCPRIQNPSSVLEYGKDSNTFDEEFGIGVCTRALEM